MNIHINIAYFLIVVIATFGKSSVLPVHSVVETVIVLRNLSDLD